MAGKKFPCGGCNKEVAKNTKSLACATCEFWFHYACVDGMTDSFYESCGQAYATWGYSAFFCKCCRKANAKRKEEMKEMKEAMDLLTRRIEVLEGEKEAVVKRVGKVEKRAVKVKEDLEGVEREIVSGMEKAMVEAKKEMKVEMRREENNSEKIVIYGLIESDKAEKGDEWREEEKGKVEEMARVMEVELEGVEAQFRARRKIEEEGVTKPRPLIVKISNDKARAKILQNSGRLSRQADWRRVFVAPEMSREQREASRKEEKELREKATRQTDEAKDQERAVRYIVVGKRGSRRIIKVGIQD